MKYSKAKSTKVATEIIGDSKTQILRNEEVWDRWQDIMAPTESNDGPVVVIQKTETRNGSIRLWMAQAIRSRKIQSMGDASSIFGNSSSRPKILRYDYTVPEDVASRFPIGEPVQFEGRPTFLSVIYRTEPFGFREDIGEPTAPITILKKEQPYHLVVMTKEGYKLLHRKVVISIGSRKDSGIELFENAISISQDAELAQSLLKQGGFKSLLDGGDDVVSL